MPWTFTIKFYIGEEFPLVLQVCNNQSFVRKGKCLLNKFMVAEKNPHAWKTGNFGKQGLCNKTDNLRTNNFLVLK